MPAIYFYYKYFATACIRISNSFRSQVPDTYYLFIYLIDLIDLRSIEARLRPILLYRLIRISFRSHSIYRYSIDLFLFCLLSFDLFILS